MVMEAQAKISDAKSIMVEAQADSGRSSKNDEFSNKDEEDDNTRKER